MSRARYTPRLSWRPIVAVRTRTYATGYRYGDEPRRGWRLYLFGVLPIAHLPRREDCVARRRMREWDRLS